MTTPARYRTVMLGQMTIEIPGVPSWSPLIRIYREEHAERYYVLYSEQVHASLAAAMQSCEANRAKSSDGGEYPGSVQWWPDVHGPVGSATCWICAAYNDQLEARERHPRRLCSVCVLEAVDATGRALRFSNRDVGGGFVATYADDGSEVPGSGRGLICSVRGRTCRASEARFGGIVVEVISGVGED